MLDGVAGQSVYPLWCAKCRSELANVLGPWHFIAIVCISVVATYSILV
ncbi:MAG: hypothetical protein IPP97_25325 [Candidatus Obscuribacter sp.]|nr:hypothetical protein [Candidatus Obscuribacter sp.]